MSARSLRPTGWSSTVLGQLLIGGAVGFGGGCAGGPGFAAMYWLCEDVWVALFLLAVTLYGILIAAAIEWAGRRPLMSVVLVATLVAGAALVLPQRVATILLPS